MFLETRRRGQEANAHAQETGRKLQVLMDAVNSEHPCPRPITYPWATTYASEQTIAAQRQFRLHQSCHGRNNPQAFDQIWTHNSDGSKGVWGIWGIQILSIPCRFWENLIKSYIGASPGGLVPPPRGNPGSATCIKLSPK